MSRDFQKDFLKLDKSKESKIALVLLVLSVIVFVIWASHIRNVFEVGYYEGIKECWVSQEFFVEMTDEGKSLYGNYFNLSTNMSIKDIMEFLDSLNYTT